MRQKYRPPMPRDTELPAQPPPLPPQHARIARTQSAQPETEETQPRRANEPTLQLEGVYIISVAARILDMHPQTLRKYEKLGLINPGRTMGMLRLYSREDIRKVRLIQHLAGNLGLNLAGVEFALSLVESLLALRQRLSAAAEGTHIQQTVDQELAALFHDMDLPLED